MWVVKAGSRPDAFALSTSKDIHSLVTVSMFFCCFFCFVLFLLSGCFWHANNIVLVAEIFLMPQEKEAELAGMFSFHFDGNSKLHFLCAAIVKLKLGSGLSQYSSPHSGLIIPQITGQTVGGIFVS